MPRGTSGAVSGLGTLAAAGGSAALATAGLLLPTVGVHAVAAAFAAGLIGAFADSVLGAGLQARYLCEDCGLVSEHTWHASCPSRGQRVSGLPGFGNDIVNALATATGAIAAIALHGFHLTG
jgi:uncharacterized membrane protein